jgi:hypothetical protein
LGLGIYNALEATPKNHDTITTFLCVAKSCRLVKERKKKKGASSTCTKDFYFFNDPKTPYFEEK